MINELAYAAALAYSPRGVTEISRRSQQVRDLVKRPHPEFLQRAAQIVAQLDREGRFPGFFGPDVVLVPVPGSAPRRDPSTLWIAEQIAHTLIAVGLAGNVWAPLQRATAVQKSAFAGAGNRPTVATHMGSFQVIDNLAPDRRILLVDDFVTKGRTMLAAASVLSETVPDADIKGFALVRTMGLQPEIERIVESALGSITWNGDAIRVP